MTEAAKKFYDEKGSGPEGAPFVLDWQSTLPK
jgi:hypothetical protein